MSERTAIDKAMEFLSLAGADELVETLMAMPLGMVKGLLKNPSELEKFLRFKQEEETEAVRKLSSMQKEILLKLLLETGGYREVRWTPKEWFGATAPFERTAFSTSLKRLESRGLVKRHSVDKTGEPKRTAVVKLTDLGHRVAKRLTMACCSLVELCYSKADTKLFELSRICRQTIDILLTQLAREIEQKRLSQQRQPQQKPSLDPGWEPSL